MAKRLQSIHKGQILMAEPYMMDSNFKRSVVLLVDHDRKEGSVGFVLNKPLSIPLNDLLANFPEFDAHVYYGGPVQNDTIHYLHNLGKELDGARKVCQGIWWGGDFEKLQFMVNTRTIKPDNIRFFVGYSGWSEGQLKEELKRGSWLRSEMEEAFLFEDSSKRLWQQIVSAQGGSFPIIANLPENIIWN